MTERADYLIVGGGTSGGFAAYAIRKADRRGRIVVVSQEVQSPYDRVPLSKEFLAGKKAKEELFFKGEAYYRRSKVEIMRGRRAEALNALGRSVRLDDGGTVAFGKLLIATGGRPRRLQLPGADLEGIRYLRTLEDAQRMVEAASKASEVVIVGGGFIGCEMAATLRGRGLKVTLAEVSEHLLGKAIDWKTARWIEEYHSRQGVTVLTKAAVGGFVGSGGGVNGVRVGGGVIPADFVAVGVGIIPNTEIAEAAGLGVDGGILVDEHMKTTAKDIYAAGDVARFYSPVLKRRMRVEHYDVAEKQGTVAGKNMAGKAAEFDELPYFFSNQYDLEINAYGDLSTRTSIVTRGKMGSKAGFLQFYLNGNAIDGVLSVNRDWEEIEKARALVEQRKELSDPSALGDESRAIR